MRPSIDDTMMQIAYVLSDRGTCCKKKVGCVATDSKGNILATGYNGQARGKPHCEPLLPCPAFTNPELSCKAIHAEMNMLMRCSNVDAIHTVYITEAPCEKCTLLIQNTGCKRIIWVTNNLVQEVWIAR